jgi:hypothetical protein
MPLIVDAIPLGTIVGTLASPTSQARPAGSAVVPLSTDRVCRPHYPQPVAKTTASPHSGGDGRLLALAILATISVNLPLRTHLL